jgi:hypothetical protein
MWHIEGRLSVIPKIFKLHGRLTHAINIALLTLLNHAGLDDHILLMLLPVSRQKLNI